MMKSPITIGLFVALFVGVCVACQQQENLGLGQGQAVLSLPAIPYSYDTAGTNDNVATLGRVLFYDQRMSVNNALSCATCHKQAKAFADNTSFSMGFQGVSTFRNSMPIQNLVASPGNGIFPGGIDDCCIFVGDSIVETGSSDTLSLFWDGRVKLLKAMVLRPVLNHVEMGITDVQALSAKLAVIPDYKNLFTKAFGTPDVDEMKIAEALSRFLMNIRANNTKFDLDRGNLTVEENRGLQLFEQQYNCNSCHRVDVLNGYQLGGGFVNIGLDLNYKDIGFADVSGSPQDVGKFKVPTLRNVALTAPYMHDGRYQTLDEVVDHYSGGILNHPNLDPRLRSGGKAIKMNIPDADKHALIAFLNTLTDYRMITDPRFANPFVVKQ